MPDPAFANMTDITHYFTTARGSTYALFADGTSIRNRSGANHESAVTGVQSRSLRTLFTTGEAETEIENLPQNKLLPDRFFVKKVAGGWAFNVALTLCSGDVKNVCIASPMPFTQYPTLGSYPIEVFDKPLAEGGFETVIHYGSKVTELSVAAESALPAAQVHDAAIMQRTKSKGRS